VRAAEWPSRPLDIETLAGRLAAAEFHAQVDAPGPGIGLTPAGWIRGLADATTAAIEADLVNGGNDWPRLWAFRLGLADEESAAELAAEAHELTNHGATSLLGIPWYQPTKGSGAFVARDAYGSRFLVAAPFSDPAHAAEVDHWYAWDLDWCAIDQVVAAGVYESADAALAEWHAAVGSAATAASFVACPPELGVRLLAPALPGSVQRDSVMGDEPREFFNEIPRLFRRAAALAGGLARRPPEQRSSALAEARGAAIGDFLDWHAGRAWSSPGARDDAEEALGLILAEWGPDAPPDERTFYACSPHRIETLVALLRDSYDPDEVNEAMRLLADWVQWCARRTELDGQLADRALSAARVEASFPVTRYPVLRGREAPFRRPE
jgi:hypothetical protein